MLRIGVPASLDADLLTDFPKEAEVIRIPDDLRQPLDIEFWVPPLYPKPISNVYSWLRGVKVVQALWAGVDWLLDIVPRDVVICDAQGSHDIATSEWAVTALLALAKYLPLYSELQRAQNWRGRNQADEAYRRMHHVEKISYPPVLVEELAEKKVLIVGYGAIGRAIEARLAPFDVSFLRVARRTRPGVEPVEKLHELLPLADAVILIVPLTPHTTGMIGARELALLKQGCMLVNAARGPVVETAPLVEALTAWKISAALDVTDPEPLPAGHPLWAAPNLLITPHIAASSPRFMERPLKFAALQAARYIRGEALQNVVVDGY